MSAKDATMSAKVRDHERQGREHKLKGRVHERQGREHERQGRDHEYQGCDTVGHRHHLSRLTASHLLENADGALARAAEIAHQSANLENVTFVSKTHDNPLDQECQECK